MEDNNLNEDNDFEHTRVMGEGVRRDELSANPVIVSFSNPEMINNKDMIKRFYDDMITYNRDR